MVRVTGKHGLAVLLVVGAAGTALWIDGRERAEPRTPAARVKPKSNPNHPVVRDTSPPVLPQLQLDRLAQRTSRSNAAGDPFESRGWTAPRERPREVAPEPVVEQAPPLPFRYLGKWTERNRVAVVLGREGRNYIAAVDEVLDGTYRIDAIENNRVVLTYLPLGEKQSLAFDTASSAGGGALPATRMQDAEAALHVVIPPQAAVAEEFTILLSLDPRQSASVERGNVELHYDPKVLNATVAGTTRLTSSAARPDTGRVQIELAGGHVGHSGPATAVKLRVVAEAPTTTQIRLTAVSASDAEERNLAVAVEGPNPQVLNIVQATKPR
jgi:hypothetical protein